MAKKAKIISGHDPLSFWMWGMVSNFPFNVCVGEKIINLHIQCQTLKSIRGKGFQIVSFAGYDEITGHKVSCSCYNCNHSKSDFGTITISNSIVSDTQLSKKYGPQGWKFRKNKLPPIKPLNLS